MEVENAVRNATTQRLAITSVAKTSTSVSPVSEYFSLSWPVAIFPGTWLSNFSISVMVQ